MPPIVDAETTGYDTVQTHEGLGASDDRMLALFTAGGAVATQLGQDEFRSIEYRIGPKGGIGPHGKIDHAILYDLVATTAGPAVLYGEITQGNSGPKGDVKLLDIGTSNEVIVTPSQAPSYSVYRAAAAKGVVVTSAVADLGEDISTWAIDGSGQLTRFSPVKPANYNTPPFYGPAVPSPDAKTLAWLEGPDTVGGAGALVGDWQLNVAQAVTGKVALRLQVGTVADDFTWFDWDGAWAVLSRGPGKPAVAVHTAAKSTVPKAICNAHGDGLLTGTVTFVKGPPGSANAAVALDGQVDGPVNHP